MPDYFLLDFDLNNAASFTIRLVTLEGSVLLQENIFLPAGNSEKKWNSGNIPSGIYLIQVSDGKSVQSFKALKI